MRRGAVAGLLAIVLAAGVVGPAVADPTYPSEHEIERARQAEAAAGDAVAVAEAQLGELAARAERLYIAAAKAVEAYNGARVLLDQAESAEQAARDRAERTAAEAEGSRVELGRVAAASYSNGGELSSLSILLDAEDGRALKDGIDALRSVTQSHGTVYRRAAEAFQAAADAAREANEALVARTEAADRAREARDAAESAVAEQEQALASVETQQEAALTELAAARGTTVELERQRQQGLAEAAAEAAEQAEQEEQPAPPMTPPVEPSAPPLPPAPPVGEPAPSTPPSPTTPEPPRPPAPPAPPPPPAPPAPPPAPPAPPPPAPPMTGAQAAIAYARAQLGKPYEWGADGPGSFDCSGLTMRAWQAGGVSLPHWSVAQAQRTSRVSYANIAPGDLIFWSDNGQASGVYHVGLYIGGGKMIHAPRPGKDVEIQNVFYWIDPAFYGRVG